MSQFSSFPPIYTTVANPSVGANGSTAPTSSTEVSGINPGGNLQPLQTDVSGNLKVTGGSPTDVSTSGSLGALNTVVPINTNGAGTAIYEISGTWVGTITFEGSNDNFTTSQAIVAIFLSGVATAAATATVNGFYSVLPQGFAKVQARMSAYTSGTATILANASAAHRVLVPLQLNPNNLQALVTQGPGGASAWKVDNSAVNQPVIPVPALVATGTLTATGVLFTQDCSQYQSASIHLTLLPAGNIVTFQISNDNINWYSCATMPGGDLTSILSTTASAAGSYTTQLNSRYFRANITTYVSGTITATAYFKAFGNSPNSVGGYVSALQLDGAGNPITSQTNGAQRAMDVGINVSGVQVDPRAIRALTSADVVTVAQAIATSLNATVVQPTAANLKASVNLNDGAGTSITLGSKVSASSLPVVIASDQGALPLPTGASTSALQTSGNTSLTTIATNTTALNLTIGATGAAVPADAILMGVKNGANMVAILQGSATSANSLPVVIASDQAAVPIKQQLAGSTALTNVASSAVTVSLLITNANRTGAAFFNDSTSTAYLKLGATASTSSYTVQILAGGYYELPFPNKMYSGAIDCIWSVANGNMRITEFT